jgi:RNA polymerase sigma-70 factor (ECF subfamily)
MKKKKISAFPVQNLRELYELHSGSVLSYLTSVSGNRELAEDLTGETFYKALLALDGFRGESSARTWLIRIARNLYLRFMERERRKVSLEKLSRRNGMLISKTSDPEKQFLQQERARKISAALLSLSEKDRTLLHLSVREDMSCLEIGEVLGLSISAVKVRLYRARRRFIQALEKERRENMTKEEKNYPL